MTRFVLLTFTVMLLVFCDNRVAPINAPDYRNRAVIYEPGGVKRSEGVVVRLFDVNKGNNDPVFTVITNNRGEFSIEELESGIYHLMACKDTLALFIDSLMVTPTFTTLRDDTLEYSSSVTGTIGVMEYHEPGTITVQIAGMDIKSVITDQFGRFTIKGLASGRWTLLISTKIPGYLPKYATVNVLPCSHDTLRDTLFLLNKNMPLIRELILIEDTLNGTIRLSWAKQAYFNFRDYLIFRDTSKTLGNSVKPSLATADTFIIDSIYSFKKVNNTDTLMRYLGYRIAIRNLDDEIGPASSMFEFDFAPKAYVNTFFTNKIDYPVGLIRNGVPKSDTVKVSFHARNRTRPLRRFFWYNPLLLDTISEGFIRDTTVYEISDTIEYWNDSAGIFPLIVIVIDNAGTQWYDTILVNIFDDWPIVNAGPDQTVITSDTIRLHGIAKKLLGTIVTWEWKIGFGSWIRNSGPDTAFSAAPFREDFVCSLAVTDEDGNRSFDDVNIKIIPSMQIKEIAAGGFHDLFLDNQGSLYGRGLATSGQIGAIDYTTSETGLPYKIASDVLGMDAGDCHTLFVYKDGTALACGWNHYGQLGDGTVENRFEPIDVLSGVKFVTAGANHSLFVKSDSTLWACGNNAFGQLGDSTYVNKSLPVQMATNVRNVAAGVNHTLIIKTDGTVWGCGLNENGQLGDGTMENRSKPVLIMAEVKAVSAGNAHSLFIKNDNSLWACGLNSAGQLGDNTVNNRLIPVKIMENVVLVAAGNNHSLILTNNGYLYACGDNSMGQLGDGTMVNYQTPKLIADNVNRIAAGGWHSLMKKNAGSVYYWGWNNLVMGIPDKEKQITKQPYLYIP